jgi:hypothetical protein
MKLLGRFVKKRLKTIIPRKYQRGRIVEGDLSEKRQ